MQNVFAVLLVIGLQESDKSSDLLDELAWYLVSYRVHDGRAINTTGQLGAVLLSTPNSLGNATVTIGTSCGNNCIYQGTQGTFSQFNTGGHYTVDLKTSRDTTFTFQITD